MWAKGPKRANETGSSCRLTAPIGGFSLWEKPCEAEGLSPGLLQLQKPLLVIPFFILSFLSSFILANVTLAFSSPLPSSYSISFVSSSWPSHSLSNWSLKSYLPDLLTSVSLIICTLLSCYPLFPSALLYYTLCSRLLFCAVEFRIFSTRFILFSTLPSFIFLTAAIHRIY